MAASTMSKGQYLLEPAYQCYIASSPEKSTKAVAEKEKSVTVSKIGRRAQRLAHDVREHVRLGSKISGTLKGKLRLGVRILRVGGVEKVFVKLFSVRQGEKLLKASQCYLSTTAGPIAGLLFISTDKVAFCSDKSKKFSSPKGASFKIRYKVIIPVEKIDRVNQSENVRKPSQKYLEVVTMDNHDFWFMGLFNYEKTFRCLQEAISSEE